MSQFTNKIRGRIAKEIAFLKSIAKLRKWVMHRYMPIGLEYPMPADTRYGNGLDAHQGLHEILERGRSNYIETMESFLSLADDFAAISKTQPEDPTEPYWDNGWLGGFGAAALYGMICEHKPAHYIEIGSGNSTKFARKAINAKQLRTKITSIDPYPRAEIDQLCDEVIRKPFQQVDLSIFDNLQSGDIVVMDGSHYCFTNSDVTVFFLDILPKLPTGVIVYIDDIYLPADYPPEWSDRYYNEQYMLAILLLTDNKRYEPILPCWFIHLDDELRGQREKIAEKAKIKLTSSNGFWMKIN